MFNIVNNCLFFPFVQFVYVCVKKKNLLIEINENI